jgi:protein-S-isoprenylcysteine O-methyltransferase Ste14
LFLLFQLAILAQRRISLPKLGFAHNLARRRITEANNMPFAATEFEFKNRFWIIGGVIFLAFFCYGLDHTNIAFALTQKILGPTAQPDTPVFDRYQLAIVTIGSLFVYLAALLRSWAESYLHSSIVHDAAIHSDQLVAEGPYRHVRNPL